MIGKYTLVHLLVELNQNQTLKTKYNLCNKPKCDLTLNNRQAVHQTNAQQEHKV